MTVFYFAHYTSPALTGKYHMPDLKDYVTTEEAAKALGFHMESVRRMLRAKELDGLKVSPKAWLVSRKSIAAYKRKTEGLGKFDPRRGNQ
jgi:excisionase family DNA binding protein